MSAALLTSPKIGRGKKVNRKRSSTGVSNILPDVPSEDQANITATSRPGTPQPGTPQPGTPQLGSPRDPTVSEIPTIRIKRAERSVVIRVRQNRLLGGVLGSLEKDTESDTTDTKQPASDEGRDDDDTASDNDEKEEKTKVSRRSNLVMHLIRRFGLIQG